VNVPPDATCAEGAAKERDQLERFAIACTARGGNPTVREGVDLHPPLTVGLPPRAANPAHQIDNQSKQQGGFRHRYRRGSHAHGSIRSWM